MNLGFSCWVLGYSKRKGKSVIISKSSRSTAKSYFMNPFEIKWQAPEFEYREKGVSWYWVSIIIAALLIGVSVWQKNFLFGFFVVLAEILMLSWANRKPSLVEFTLTEKGLSVGGQKFHAYADIESFSAEEYAEQEGPDLYFQFKKRLRTMVKIKTPKARFHEILKALNTFLPQVKHEPSLLDAFEEFVGF